MYEWESKIDKNAVASNLHRLRQEAKRISNVTLRGSFTNQDDRKYWEVKLRKINSEISALEQM